MPATKAAPKTAIQWKRVIGKLRNVRRELKLIA
jgi:hypothetical protein